MSLRISLSFTYDYDKHSKQKELPCQLFPLIILNVTDAFAWFVLTPQTTRRLLSCQAHKPSKFYEYQDVARLFTVFHG